MRLGALGGDVREIGNRSIENNRGRARTAVGTGRNTAASNVAARAHAPVVVTCMYAQRISVTVAVNWRVTGRIHAFYSSGMRRAFAEQDAEVRQKERSIGHNNSGTIVAFQAYPSI